MSLFKPLKELLHKMQRRNKKAKHSETKVIPINSLPAVTGGVVYGYKTCKTGHNGATAVKVGKYKIYLGAEAYITAEALSKADVLVPLNGDLPRKLPFSKKYMILSAYLMDYGGVPSNELWKALIDNTIKELKSGRRVLAWCAGSHGRTGTFLSSLIGVLEPNIDDPIKAARDRHCKHAVETLRQAKAVFDLIGKELPEHYKKEFTVSTASHYIPGTSAQDYGEHWYGHGYGHHKSLPPPSAAAPQTPHVAKTVQECDYVYFDCKNKSCECEIKKSTHDYSDWKRICPDCGSTNLQGPYSTARKAFTHVHQVQVGTHPNDLKPAAAETNPFLALPDPSLEQHHEGCMCSVCSTHPF